MYVLQYKWEYLHFAILVFLVSIVDSPFHIKVKTRSSINKKKLSRFFFMRERTTHM